MLCDNMIVSGFQMTPKSHRRLSIGDSTVRQFRPLLQEARMAAAEGFATLDALHDLRKTGTTT